MSRAHDVGATQPGKPVRHKLWGRIHTLPSTDISSIGDHGVFSEGTVEYAPFVPERPGVFCVGAGQGNAVRGGAADLRSLASASSTSNQDTQEILSRFGLDPDSVDISSSSDGMSESSSVEGGNVRDDVCHRKTIVLLGRLTLDTISSNSKDCSSGALCADDDKAFAGGPEQHPNVRPLPSDPLVHEPGRCDDTPYLGLSSIGALEHGTGRCLPCAWLWKPNGCCHGKACTFCHSCPEDERRRRRRERNYMLSIQRASGIRSEPSARCTGKRKGSGKSSA